MVLNCLPETMVGVTGQELMDEIVLNRTETEFEYNSSIEFWSNQTTQ